MIYKNKRHKKSNLKTSNNKIKRRIFVVIRKNNKKNKKNKKHFKIKKFKRKTELYYEPEEFDNIPTIFFSCSSLLNTENKREEVTKQSQSNIKDIDDFDFDGIINIKTNIHKINSVG